MDLLSECDEPIGRVSVLEQHVSRHGLQERSHINDGSADRSDHFCRSVVELGQTQSRPGLVPCEVSRAIADIDAQVPSTGGSTTGFGSTLRGGKLGVPTQMRRGGRRVGQYGALRIRLTMSCTSRRNSSTVASW